MSLRKPGSLLACWWNIVLCAGLIIATAVVAVRGEQPLAFLVTAIGVGLEIYYVRILLEVLKERREGSSTG